MPSPIGTRSQATRWSSQQAATGTAEEQQPNIFIDLATLHVAIYDAVNAIVGTHKRYAATPSTPAAGASQEAATAAAAYGVLKALFPNRSAQYQAAYDSFIAAIPADDARTRGIAVGTEVATAIVALRANDGRLPIVTYAAGTAPGKFRGVNPVGTNNRFLKPFTLTSASQFRAPPPPALDSAAYAADVNETQAWGSSTSTLRSADQTEAARFHTENPALLTSRNYRAFAMDSRSLADNARGMALLWVTLADVTIACFEYEVFLRVLAPDERDQVRRHRWQCCHHDRCSVDACGDDPESPRISGSSHLQQRCRNDRIEGALRHQPGHVQLWQHGHWNGASVQHAGRIGERDQPRAYSRRHAFP